MEMWQSVRYMRTRIKNEFADSWHGRRDDRHGLPTAADPGHLAKLHSEDRALQEACANDLAGRQRKDQEKRAELVRILDHRTGDEQRFAGELAQIEAEYPIGAYPANDSVPLPLRKQRDRLARDRAGAAKRAQLEQARARRQATEALLETVEERLERRRVRFEHRADEYRGWMEQRAAIYARANARARARRLQKETRRAER
jgi:hypothetical protein